MARTIGKNPRQDMSRLRRFAQNHLGVLFMDEMSGGKVVRKQDLELLDQYYDGTQYDDLQDWEQAQKSDTYVAVRDRKPRVIYNLPKALVNKVSAKLIGSATFPQFVVEEDDESTDFFRTVQKACKFRKSMIEPTKMMLKSGACFVRFYLANGSIRIEGVESKYCWPTFDAVGELEQIEIRYVYEDWQDLDKSDKPKKKWYKNVLSKSVDVLFDNPDYNPGSTPTFKEVARAEHGLDWVQGEWLVTHEDKFDYDGMSLYGDILDFCDELNYSLSQTSQAVSYTQEPQLTVNQMDEDEIDGLVRSSQKAWNLGREGKAEYVNLDTKGLDQAEKTRDHIRDLLLDVVRVVLHDPEKLGNAQSGTALMILNAPLVELVDELRQVIEPKWTSLLIKIGLTALHYNSQGEDTVLEAPPGYIPASFDITTQWPPIFPPTLQDIQVAAQAAQALSTGKIISRESLTKWIAQMIPSVDNIAEELQKIESEPDLNPFGSFGGGGAGENG